MHWWRMLPWCGLLAILLNVAALATVAITALAAGRW